MTAKTEHTALPDERAGGKFVADLTSGLVMTILNVTTAISIAALVFAGMPSRLFFVGVAILLFSTVICGLGGTLGSGFARVISGPRSGLAPLYAAIVASIASGMSVDAPGFLPTLLASITLATLATGAFLFVVGQFHLGTLIRYIPYPVMAGFFAGIGLIFVLGGIAVASGEGLSLSNLAYHLSGPGLQLTAPALGLGVLLYAATLKLDHWSVFPLILAAAIAVFYLALFLTGMTPQAAIAAGWLPKPAGVHVALPFLKPADLGLVDWSIVLGQGAAFASLALLTTIILLVDSSGIEMIADAELDPDRELKVAGLTNLVSGALGGYTGTQAASDTALFLKLGAKSRLAGFVYAGLVALVMVVGTRVVDAIPSYVLGGLLLYFGLDFLVAWTWARRRDLRLYDFAVVLAIVAAIASVGLLDGIAIGFAFAVVLFVISYSRLSVVKAEFGGDIHDSIVMRHPEEQAFLNRHGRRIWIMRFQGFLFFGTADRLLRTVRERVERAETPKITHLVLDFANVSQLDTSAVQTLAKLAKYARREGLSLVLSGLDEDTQARMAEAGFAEAGGTDGAHASPFHPSLDAAVAWCEADLLRDFDRSADRGETGLDNLLARLCDSAEAAQALAPYFSTEEVAAGGYLFREGDEGTSLYLLAAGTASVVVNADTDHERIVRIFQQGTMVGEMALFTGEPRSASVRADSDATFHGLTRDDFLKAQLAHPEATGRLQSYIVRLLAERLGRANRKIQSLD